MLSTTTSRLDTHCNALITCLHAAIDCGDVKSIGPLLTDITKFPSARKEFGGVKIRANFIARAKQNRGEQLVAKAGNYAGQADLPNMMESLRSASGLMSPDKWNESREDAVACMKIGYGIFLDRNPNASGKSEQAQILSAALKLGARSFVTRLASELSAEFKKRRAS